MELNQELLDSLMKKASENECLHTVEVTKACVILGIKDGKYYPVSLGNIMYI